MRSSFSQNFLTKPICHRALHDPTKGIYENSLEAIQAAVRAGLPIEIDLQNTFDARAVVFHDDQVNRLTNQKGKVNKKTLKDMENTPLLGGNSVIGFERCLKIIDGQIPVLVELKDQDGRLGSNLGSFIADIVQSAKTYQGALAFMSFNPYLVAELQKQLPQLPMGLTTDAFSLMDWPKIPKDRRKRLQNFSEIPGLEIDFISHHWRDLERIQHIKKPKICWTIRSREEEKLARKYADNITFESYTPEGL